VDPFAVLGLDEGAGAEEAAAAYRRLAKEWHPDRRGGGPDADLRMAEINAAYDLLRAEQWLRRQAAGAPRRAREREPEREPRARDAPRRAAPGSWLSEPLRRALGRELLVALEPGEDVALVTPAATWASPQALLAVTDRRLLWLLDDAPTHRVRSLRFDAIVRAEVRLRRPLRRVASVRIRARSGRRLAFSELRPQTAEAIVGRIAGFNAR
jgi:DnaJ-like protein